MPELPPILANGAGPADDFEREASYHLARLLVFWNLNDHANAARALQALANVWVSSPGHGFRRFGVDAAGLNQIIVPPAEAAGKEARPMPPVVLPWHPVNRGDGRGL